jgi:phosphopantetheinyl transferase
MISGIGMDKPVIRIYIREDEDWQEQILELAAESGRPGAGLERGVDGKPFLSGAGDFHFNVSTTRGRTVAATGAVPVGIDWEHTGRQASCERIARRYFSDEECRWMEAAREGEMAGRFFSLWTAKEAGVKLDGCGLYTGGLCNCRIQLGDPKKGETPVRGMLNGREFHLRQVCLPGGFLVAVACYVDFQLALPPDFSMVVAVK